MQNFGISQNQPIQSNYPVGPKKKDDKQEKIQKAVTYTLGALAGVGVAVANAYDELKAVANFTTTNPVEKGGFAEAVYKFIKF